MGGKFFCDFLFILVKLLCGPQWNYLPVAVDLCISSIFPAFSC